jgi:3-oxoacyl-[acyl-carrier protein] reductase
VLALHVDVTDEVSVERLFQATAARWGRVDILVNAAGVLTMGTVAELRASDWRRALDVNLTGVFLCSQAALRSMLARPPDEDGLRGALVQIVSGSGVHGWPGAAAYTASKFGVMGLSEAMRDEVRAQGVRVIDVLPGMVATDMTADPRFARRPKLAPGDVAHAVLAALTASPAAMVTRVDVRHQHLPPA